MANNLPSYASPEVVAQARAHWRSGDYGKAWRVLADNGDGYADNAAAVTGDVRDGSDYAMQTMVRNHWENATGSSEAYDTKFRQVVGIHLDNYLKLLENGKIPNSNDIVASYKLSLKVVELSPVVAFDAAWESAFGNNNWAHVLGMDPDRISVAWADTSGMAGTLEERAKGKFRIEYAGFGQAAHYGGLCCGNL